MTQDSYYVYVLLDPRRPGIFSYGKWTFTHKPFYVGKGKGSRAHRHYRDYLRKSKTQGYNTRKVKRIAGIHEDTGSGPIVKAIQNLSEERAFELEALVIAAIGRGKGEPLVNLSDGGIGGNGVKRQPFTPERSAAMSKAISELHASRPAEFWVEHGEKTRSYWAKLKKDDPDEYNRLRAINAECSKARWSKPGARAKHADGQRAIIQARYASMTPLDKAKFNLKKRLGHLLRRLQSQTERMSVKEEVYAFIESSRHKLPERFNRAADRLLAQHQLV